MLNNPNSVDKLTIVGRSVPEFKKNYPQYALSKKIEFIKADILTNINSLGSDYTHVIHAAADSTNVGHLSHLDRYDQIVEGTRSVLEFIKRFCPDSRLLFVSSGGVYGDMPNNLNSFREDHHMTHNSLDPSKVYSIAKRSAENLCAIYSDIFNLRVSVARCFSFSGIDLPLNVHFAIGNFVKNAIDSEDIIIKGDGLSVRSYLDQDDLADWLLKICEFDTFNRTVYNIGSNQAINILSLAEKVAEISNKEIKIKVLNSENSNISKSIYVPDISKILGTFNIKVNISLEDSIRKMINFHQNEDGT